MVDARQSLGRRGEALAETFLRDRGYSVLARNWRGRQGELDLVAVDHGVVVFVEVRTKTGVAFGTPFETVDSRKRRKLGRLALEFLTRERLGDRNARFDVIGVVCEPGREPRIDHLESAFELEAR